VEVYLGVGQLAPEDGVGDGRVGYDTLVRHELGGRPVYSTHQREPDFTSDGAWHEAPRLLWTPGPGAGGETRARPAVALDLTASEAWDDATAARVGAVRAAGQFPVVVGHMADGRLALRTEAGFVPTVPRELARVIAAAAAGLGVDVGG